MDKQTVLYEGKAKRVFKTESDDVVRLEYLDQATALNGKKKEAIVGKGTLNNAISSQVFECLTKYGIKHHWLRKVSETEQLVKKVTIIPLEVVIRNVATGSFIKRFGVAEGSQITPAMIEFYYKNDELDDPFMNEAQIGYLKLANPSEIAFIKQEALKINTVLCELFDQIGFDLIDLKLEFGKDESGNIMLADEISPDTCRLWDKQTQASFDKDIFRKDQGDLIPVYEAVNECLAEYLQHSNRQLFHAKVEVSYKDSILDPQAEVIEKSMNQLISSHFTSLKLSKNFSFQLEAETEEVAAKLVDQICDQLLANVTMETYHFTLTEVK